MRLMLLRHAKSQHPAGVDDHERPLSERGRKASGLMGGYMARQGLVPDLALVSTAVRTQETWRLARPAFHREIDWSSEGRIYEASSRVLMEILRGTAGEIASLLVIGHNPGLQDLALGLIGDAEPGERKRLADKLPTAGLVVIDFKGDDWRELAQQAGRLERFVTPGSIVH